MNYITKDTGLGRQKFDTGSQRDLRVGKGRFDLIPASVLPVWAREAVLLGKEDNQFRLLNWGLAGLFAWFNGRAGYDAVAVLLAAVAAVEYGPPRGLGVSGLQWPVIERWAQLMERGAEKYGERNWELGQPLSRFYDSGLRHFYQWHFGVNTEEDHLAAIFYNLGALIYTAMEIEEGRLPSELDDRPVAKQFRQQEVVING